MTLLALVGPTATGKTQIALALAPMLGAEIVSIDSMTVYRGMDVGTAKPTAEERARVAHHLLDVRAPGEPFSVAEFQRQARDAIRDIRARGRTPMLVGGSGLYFRAVVDALAFPPTDPAVRAALEAEPLDRLVERLRALDPDALAFVDIRNPRRVVRALEVVEVTGRPFSSFREAWERFDDDVAAAGLTLPTEERARRIEARVRGMMAGGLLEETRRLLDAGHRHALAAPQPLGYREALQVLDGELSEEEAVERIARATRRLARRQMSWFRRDPRITWFDATDIGDATGRIAAYYRARLDDEPAETERGARAARTST